MAQPIHVQPAGTREALVTVEVKTLGGGGGFPVETWAPLITLWMRKVDLMGAEAFQADQMSARYDVRFIAPYGPQLDPELVDVPATHRLRYLGKTYDITHAAIIGRYEGITYAAIAPSAPES